jgi:hypothetical protein
MLCMIWMRCSSVLRRTLPRQKTPSLLELNPVILCGPSIAGMLKMWLELVSLQLSVTCCMDN